jgi:Beta-lactamase class C and other penicillin binding proteins
LSHTSGLPEYFDFPVTYFDTSHLLTNQELITILIKEKVPSIFAPGYNYKYINTNYVLLASIVEKVADLRFEDFVRQNIFIPAGMTQTFFSSEKEENSDKSIAKGHLKNKSELPVNYLDGTLGDKGIYSNPEEMLKWKEAYFVQKKIIGTELLNKATSKQNYIKGKGKANEMYGYGLRIEETPEFGKLIYHGGLWRGYQNVFVYRPSDNTVIIFLSNYRNSAHLGKSNEILQVLDGA